MMKRLFTNQTLSARLGGNQNSNRAISLLLSFALLLTMMPQMLLFPVHSEGTEQVQEEEQAAVPATSVFDKYVGYTATFADYYEDFVLAEDASAVTGYDNITWNGVVEYSLSDYIGDDSVLTEEEIVAREDEFYALEMIVTASFVSEEEHGALWFKVEAAEGVTLPEVLQNNPWIFAYYSGWDGDEENTALFLTPPKVDVAVEGLPEGATVSGFDLSAEVGVGGNVGVYDISVKDAEGNPWQPAVGETVRVSLPVADGVETVDIYHYMESAEHIAYALENGLAETVDISSEGEAILALLENAILAYQTATSSEDIKVAAERFVNVPVINGCATVQSQGFSVYIKDANEKYTNVYGGYFPTYAETNETLYITPGSIIKFTGVSNHGFDCSTSNTELIAHPDITKVKEEKNHIGLDGVYSWAYFTVPNTIEEDTVFYVKHGISEGFLGMTFTEKYLKVVVVAEVPVTDTPIRIGIYNYDDNIPAEPSDDVLSQFYYCTLGDNNTVKLTLGNDEEDAKTYNSGKVNLDFTESEYGFVNETMVNASGEKIIDSDTGLFAIVDTSGNNKTLNYLTGFSETLQENIIQAYLTEKNISGSVEDYKLIVYVIKYDAAWIINCKVVYAKSVTLDFWQNPPVGFNLYDLAEGQTFPASVVLDVPQKPGYASYTIQSYVQYTMTNAEGKKATFYGWNTDPNAIPFDPDKIDPETYDPNNPPYTVDGWYFATADGAVPSYATKYTNGDFVIEPVYSDDITVNPNNPLGYSEIYVDENTTLYAIWIVDEGYETANIEFTNHVVNQYGQHLTSCDAVFEFTFNIQNVELQGNAYNYIIYDENAQPVPNKSGTIGHGGTFELEAGWYIEIQGVPNSAEPYLLMEEGKAGFTAQEVNDSVYYSITADDETGAVTCSITITSATNVSGEILVDIIHNVTTATIQYDTNGGDGTFEPHVEILYDGNDEVVLPHYDQMYGELKFAGWNTAADGSGETYSAGQLITISEDLVLYAKWELPKANLTISVTGADVSDYFVFKVTGDGMTLLVTVKGENSVTIQGLSIDADYEVELTTWSWKYGTSPVTKSVTIGNSGSEVEFAVSPTDSGWLDGEASGEYPSNDP